MRPATAVTVLLLAWSVLAFASPYPWAYWPLGVGCVTVFVLGWLRRPEGVTSVGPWPWVALAVGLVQLIPVPRQVFLLVSPGARRFADGTAFNVGNWTFLSLTPTATIEAIAWSGCLLLLIVGLRWTCDERQARQLSSAIAVLAVGVAILGLNQRNDGLLYGWWQPKDVADPFGPFVNRNHFAGWMVLAIACGIGRFGAIGASRHKADGWLGVVKVTASPEGSQRLILGLALLVMCLSVAASLSRSGLISCGGVLIVATFAWLRRDSRLSKVSVLAGVGYVTGATVVALLVMWVSGDALASRLSSPQQSLQSRLEIWSAATATFREFPLIGSGLGSFGFVNPAYQTTDPSQGTYLQAHNDYLQALAEGGILLCVPLLLVVKRLGCDVLETLRASGPTRSYWIAAGAAAGLVGIGAQETVEFSLRSPAVAILFAVCCALATHRLEPESPR